MKTSSLLYIGLVTILFTLSCALPFNVSVNINTQSTDAPTQPSAAPSATTESTATPDLKATKTSAAAAVLTQSAATSTAEIENKIMALAECMRDVPIRGDVSYNTVICEDFTDNANDWQTGTDDNPRFGTTTRSIKDGQYIWDVSTKHGVFHWECIKTPDLDNFEASMQVQKLRGPTSEACYAMVFRVKKASGGEWNYYAYFVCDDNFYYVARQSNKAWSPVSYKKPAGAVKPGSPNWLTVIADGGRFEFYVNDHKAGVSQDDRLKSGGICIGMEVPANLDAGFAFDKFVIRAP